MKAKSSGKSNGATPSEDLLVTAQALLANSYSPYSKCAVSSVLRLTNGRVYTGVNIENASYGATVCAERVAIWKAVSENPKTKVAEIVVCTDQSNPWPPCGLCRQVLAEFAASDLVVHLANKSGIKRKMPFTELFPEAFTGHFLGR